MDERTLNELLECSVCLDRLDTTSKVLPCQHTFCRRCLEEIISTKHELRCPECRYLVDIRIEDLPANILLIRLLEGMKTCSTVGSDASTLSTPSKRLEVGSSKVFANKSQFLSQPCARALYNYDAKEEGDLSFKKGDLILLKKQVDENWFHGERNGRSGFFPATYVQVLLALPAEEPPRCTALYDFIINDQNEKDCLTFHKDEIITVIRRVDEHWAEGRLGDRIGIFPISFVDFNDSAKWLLNAAPQTSVIVGLRTSQQRTGESHATPISSTASSPQNITAEAIVAGANIAGACGVEVSGTGDSGAEASAAVTTAASTQASPTSPESSSTATAVTVGILITTAPSPTTASSSVLAFAAATSLNTRVHPRNGSAAAQKRHSLTTLGMRRPPPNTPGCAASSSQQQQRHSMELPLSFDVLSLGGAGVTTPSRMAAGATQGIMTSMTPVMMTAVETGASSGESSAGAWSARVKSALPAIYMALYNYKPQKSDEVELSKGGYYTVYEKCQDGWYKGACLRSGCAGVFPGNYVQMVHLSSAIKTSMASAMLASLAASSACIKNAVGRTQSFPKTSPHFKAPASHGSLSPSSMQSPIFLDAHSMHNPLPASNSAKGPSRTITNVTQAQSRTNNGSHMGVNSPVSLTNASLASMAALSASPRVSAIVSGSTSDCGSAASSPTAYSRDFCGSNNSGRSWDDSHICTSTHSGSPRPARRQKRQSMKERGRHTVSAGTSARLQASPALRGWSTPPPPPNIVVGAVATSGVEGATGATAAVARGDADRKHSAKKERRSETKERLTLMKRLASHGIPLKGRKSRSPPPQLLQPPRQPRHQRSGSEGSIVEGAMGMCIPTPRKSETKAIKVKPLNRDKCRCVEPYPPQSDIELELKVGDVVYIHKTREDGWFKGTHARTGKTGLFPGCFVEKI